MLAVNHTAMENLGWLAYPPGLPLPGLLLGCVAAAVAVTGSLSFRRKPHRRLAHQVWLWASLVVVALLAYVTVGFYFIDPFLSLTLALWWSGPVAVILFGVAQAASPCKTRSRLGTRP